MDWRFCLLERDLRLHTPVMVEAAGSLWHAVRYGYAVGLIVGPGRI